MRLLGPAVVAWAVLAATVDLPVAALGMSVATAAAACAGAIAASTRRAGSGGREGRHAAPPTWPARLLLVGAACGLLQAAALARAVDQERGGLGELVADRATVTLIGRVATDPRRMPSRFGEEQVFFVLDVDEVTGRGQRTSTSARVTVTGGDELLSVPWWSRIQVRGRLAPPRDTGPEVGWLSATSTPRVARPPPVVARMAETMRSALQGSVDSLPKDARGLLPGLVIGDTSALPPDLDDAMKATGMTHLTAVSGSNVAVVIGLVLAGCTATGVPRRLRPWLAMIVLAGFVVLARPEPSVLRAAAMGAIGLLGISRNHRSSGPPLLGGAILVVLTVDPWLARSYGFVLSTLATLGLLILAGPWGDAMAPRLGVLHPRLRLLGPAIAVPLAAQVVCGPVIVLLQGSVPVVGVVANLLAAPLVPIATIGGVACAGVGIVSPTVGGWLAWLPALPTLGIARVARFMAVVPGGSVPWPDGATGAILLTVLTVLLLIVGRSLLLIALGHPIVTVLAIAVVIGLITPTRVITWPPPGWRLVACDVGQGDGLILRSGPGRAVVVDTGPDADLIDACLDRLDVDIVDALVLTHFHADHVDGIEGVSRGRPVRALYGTDVEEPEFQAEAVARWAGQHGLSLVPLHAGDHLNVGDFTADVWWPARRIDAGSVANNASVVLAARTGDVDALLLGDIERESAAAILSEVRRRPTFAAAARSFEVVKTPHHGSANLDPELMAAIRAPVGIISVGEGNDYGHPAPSHLTLLRRLGYAVYRTDLRGDVAIVESGHGPAVVTSR